MTPGLLDRLADRSARVVVMGQGYVGLPVALRAVEVGFTVLGFDIDAGRVASLRTGRSHVGDVSDEQLGAALRSGYSASADPVDLAGFDVAVISVPTPLRNSQPDLSAIEGAAALLAPHVRPGCCVVLESTTYPGTTNELVAPILSSVTGLEAGRDFRLGYSPERIDPGNRAHTLVNTPKVVSGVDRDSLEAVDTFYRTLVERTVPVATCEEAETVKLLENTFRHVNIALVNELAVFAHELGIDIWNVIDAASTKPFGFMRFTPGPGVGGHCLPVDPSYLGWRVRSNLGRTFRFVELANDVNDHMPDHVVHRVVRMLNDRGVAVKGASVLLLGLAYKSGTGDWRESPSVPIARGLQEWGAEVSVCDPHVGADAERLDLPLVPFSGETLAAADIVVLLVDHAEFDPEVIARAAGCVFDAKGALRGVRHPGGRL